jgi:site-specific recombinase XerD
MTPPKKPAPNGTEKPSAAETRDFFPEEWLTKLKAEMAARKYSMETARAYVHYNKELCGTSKRGPAEMTSDNIRSYIARLEGQGLSASTMNLAISALKFFYNWVAGRNIVAERKRPRQRSI